MPFLTRALLLPQRDAFTMQVRLAIILTSSRVDVASRFFARDPDLGRRQVGTLLRLLSNNKWACQNANSPERVERNPRYWVRHALAYNDEENTAEKKYECWHNI